MSLTKVSYSMITGAVFNVLDYGATGNGTTSDSTAINAAIVDANANGGGVLFFPVGTYRLTAQILLKPGVSLIGEQRGEPNEPGVKFSKEFLSGSVFYSPNTQIINSVTYQNFYIIGNKNGLGGTNGSGFEIQKASGVNFYMVWARECPSSGFDIGQGSTSYHNYFYNCYAFFNGASGFVVHSDWMRFIDCWADGNYVGIEFPVSDSGSFAHIERCHFEEFEFSAIAILGNPSLGANGNNIIRDCVIFSRPYPVSPPAPAHGIYIDTSKAQGASGNQITGNYLAYQATHGPTKAGKYGIYLFGGGAPSGIIIANNQIGGFDYNINLTTGPVRNIIFGNYLSDGNLGFNNAASLNEISSNVFTNNTSDLSDTGSSARISDNYFTVAPTFAATSLLSNNYGVTNTFTPVLAFGGASTGITFTTNLGRFEQNGKNVTAYYWIVLSNKGSATGAATLSLPTTCSGNPAVGQVYMSSNPGTIIGPVLGFANPGNDKFLLTVLNAASNYASGSLTETGFTNTTEFFVTVTYEA
jgi:hypothetical protein